MKLLDLYCGAGGAAMGYHRAGFDEIVGVDIKPQPNYPFEFVQGDALEYVAAHGREFDVIHASPPCQRYSEATPVQYRAGHPDMIGSTRDALRLAGVPYVIENVEGARSKLKSPILLCGSMFGLQTYRHRYFEIWPPVLILAPPCRHDFTPLLVTTAGSNSRRNGNYKSVKHAPAAYNIDWMVGAELAQAIPPAYTEWIGKHILKGAI